MCARERERESACARATVAVRRPARARTHRCVCVCVCARVCVSVCVCVCVFRMSIFWRPTITEKMISHTRPQLFVQLLLWEPSDLGGQSFVFRFSADIDPQTIALNIAKLDWRLVQLCTEYQVSPQVMAMCGDAGVDSVATLAGLADSKQDFRPASR